MFKLEVHIAWITKYRYKVLTSDIGTRTRDLLRQICTENKVDILKGSVSPDHIHMLVSIDPTTSVSKLVRYLKGKTSRKLQTEYPQLRKRYWGQHLWARGYFAVSTGNVTTSMIAEYINHHAEGTASKDTFIVEDPRSASAD